MKLIQVPFTNNIIFQRNVNKADNRYTTFQNRGPQGIVVHDTSAGNPTLRRYVQPNVGGIGVNTNNNHWNRPEAGEVLLHAWIGTLQNGDIATAQCCPWNYRGIHCGTGSRGTFNDSHIGFEICDDGFSSRDYFSKVYKEAVELCAHICRECKLNPMGDGVIVSHREAGQRGMGSNSSDPHVWFDKFGKTMDMFRQDVRDTMNAAVTPPGNPPPDASSEWAREAWQWAFDNKLMDGTNPTQPFLREQMAQVLLNLNRQGFIGK